MIPVIDFQVMDLGDVCSVVDGMIDNAVDFRTRYQMEYDSIIVAYVHQGMIDKLEAWGAVDYLRIAYHIHIKLKEQ